MQKSGLKRSYRSQKYVSYLHVVPLLEGDGEARWHPLVVHRPLRPVQQGLLSLLNHKYYIVFFFTRNFDLENKKRHDISSIFWDKDLKYEKDISQNVVVKAEHSAKFSKKKKAWRFRPQITHYWIFIYLLKFEWIGLSVNVKFTIYYFQCQYSDIFLKIFYFPHRLLNLIEESGRTP